jgi:hypothetical protein
MRSGVPRSMVLAAKGLVKSQRIETVIGMLTCISRVPPFLHASRLGCTGYGSWLNCATVSQCISTVPSKCTSDPGKNDQARVYANNILDTVLDPEAVCIIHAA